MDLLVHGEIIVFDHQPVLVVLEFKLPSGNNVLSVTNSHYL